MAWQKIVLLCVALCIVNSSAFRKRILNGQNAKIRDYPYQVSLRENGEHFCGGSIISDRHIITAGHCVIIKKIVPPYTNFTVVSGTKYTFEGGKAHRIANASAHPDLKCDKTRCIGDIAVITLEKPIVFNQFQQKINLPEENYKVGQRATITGWGSVQIKFKFPDVLQKIETTLISLDECRKNVYDIKKTPIFDTEVCASHSLGAGSCFGDSGGPLAVDGKLVGIVSWSDGGEVDCGSGHPDVFTNVYKYKDFINSVTSQTV